MRVLEEREKKHLNSERNNTKLLVIKPPRSLFKVVVNNYRQKERFPDKEEEEIVETMNMPLQKSGYIKYPEYDWF